MMLHNHSNKRKDVQVSALESSLGGRARLTSWRLSLRWARLRAGVAASMVLGLLLGAGPVQAESGSVSPYYGSFATAVPIAVPPFRGLEPAVEITYGSSGGNGWCGVGGSLKAASLIERGLPEGGSPRYNDQDAFYLDGMELIATNLLGGTHCAKIQNYARIIRDASHSLWYVTGTQGNRATYEPLLTNALGTYRWAITRMEDPRGNIVQFHYWHDGTNDAYLAGISYNGCQVLFNWELRPDPILFADGAVMHTTRYRLNSIDVKVGEDRARAYAVTYTTSAVSGRSLIQSVQQFGRDAVIAPDGSVTSGTSLPPMTFGWSTNSTGQFANRVDDQTDGFIYTGFERFVTDVNGDGRDDILYVSDSEFAVFLSEGYGNFGPRIAGGVDGPFAGYTRTVGDVNADGFADIVYVGNTDVAILLGNGNGTFGRPIQTSIASSQAGKTRATADVTGDQRLDVCFIGDSEITVLRGNGDGSFATPVNTPTGYTDLSGVTRVTGDVNGDGRADIAFVGDSQYTLYIANGDGTFAPAIRQPLGATYANHDRYLTDVNGDGKADLVFIGDNGFAVLLGLGNGLFLPAVTGSTGVALSGYDRYIADVNGDGHSDLLYINNAALSVFPGRGDGTFGARIASTTGGSSLAGFSGRIGDLDGDGKADVVFVGDSSFAAFLSEGGPPDLVNLIHNGIGGTTEVDYQPSSAWRNTYMPKGMSLNTVAGLTTSDGRSTTNTVTFSYEGGLWSATDKRFLGFRRVASVIDPRGDYTETYYFQRVGSISKPEFTYAKDNQGRIYSYSAYRYTENTAPPYTSLLTERWDYTLNLTDRARRTLTQFGYDMHANCIVTYEYGDFDIEGDERTTIRGYYPNHSLYIVGLPAYENTYAGIGSGGQLMARSVTHYDNNTTFAASPRAGNATAVGRWNDQNGDYIYTRFDYDTYGNQTRQIDALGFEGRIEFDSVYHIFPLREMNALNHTMAHEWDCVLGEKLSDTDPNGSVMRFTYDALGRQLTVLYPDGASEAYSYHDIGNPNGQYTRRTIPDGSADGLWSEIYRDGLGRVYRTHRKGNVEQLTEFRGTGEQILRQAVPCRVGEPSVWTSFEYDGLGRVRRAFNADASYSETIYDNDANGKPYEIAYNEVGAIHMTWADAYGQVVEVREQVNGQCAISSYAYNANSKLVQAVDPGGLVTQVKWDSLGRRLEVRDPNMGTTRYEYDSRGAVLKSTDARGSTVSYTYDQTGRILSKTTSDGAIHSWSYDQPGGGASIGQLTREEYPQGYTQHIWDRRGRETATVRRIGTDTIATQSDFDIVGRLTTLTYPDGQVVRHYYLNPASKRGADTPLSLC